MVYSYTVIVVGEIHSGKKFSLPASGGTVPYDCLGADEGTHAVVVEVVHGIVCDVVLYIWVSIL